MCNATRKEKHMQNVRDAKDKHNEKIKNATYALMKQQGNTAMAETKMKEINN